MNPEVKVMVKYFTLTVDGKTLNFNHSGHCEQVLRGLVHSGHTVTIKEVTEIKTVTQSEINQYRADDVNWRYVEEPKNKLQEACCETAACVPAGIGYR